MALAAAFYMYSAIRQGLIYTIKEYADAFLYAAR